MKQILLDNYQTNGQSQVEAFIDSYLELIGSGETHETIGQTCSWVEVNPYYDPNEEYSYQDQYLTTFVIEDVEDWFGYHARSIDLRGKWTNQDVRDVFDGKCAKKYGYKIPYCRVQIGEIQEYRGVQYVGVENLFFACPTFLIKTPDDKVFSIWY